MSIVKSAAALAVARKVYDYARRPENQARLKSAVDRARDSVRGRLK